MLGVTYYVKCGGHSKCLKRRLKMLGSAFNFHLVEAEYIQFITVHSAVYVEIILRPLNCIESLFSIDILVFNQPLECEDC